MYTRVTSVRVNAASLADLPAKVQEMTAGAKALPGIIDIYVSWRADGQGVVTSVYDGKASADSATAKIAAIWGGLAGMLAAAPTNEAYDNVEHLVG